MKISEKRMRKIMSGISGSEKCARLMQEVSKRRRDLVGMLLELGADANFKDSTGWSVLHAAACVGDAEIVGMLLKAGADPNGADRNGWNPLYMAVRKGYADVISILLKAGTRADMRDCDGWNLLHAAAYNGDIAAMKEIITYGGDPVIKNNTGTSAMDILEKLYPDKYKESAGTIITLFRNVSSLKREDGPDDDEGSGMSVDFNI